MLLLEHLLKYVIITLFSLCGCSLTTADCEALAQMLSGGSQLRVLNLYGNNLEDQGLIHLSSALENCRLQEIKYTCTIHILVSLSNNIEMKAMWFCCILQSGFMLTDGGIHACAVFSSEQRFFRAEEAKPEPERSDG